MPDSPSTLLLEPGSKHDQSKETPQNEKVDQLSNSEEMESSFSFEELWVRTKAWVRSAAAAGFGVSLIIHLIALLIMSVIVISSLNIEPTILTTFLESDDDPIAVDEVLDVRIDMPAGELAATESLLSTETPLEELADIPVQTGLETSIDSLFNKEGSGGAGGGGFVPPKNTKVFTKGSFTVWTVPNDPLPGQDYTIAIAVRLPDRVKRYRASDLSGIVIGTDGYRQAIPGREYTRGKVYLPMKDHTAQIMVRVPGAQQKVRDTIQVRSTILKEKQQIEIVF